MRQNRAILVLGMHRSGTSLTAELIDRWGAYGGEGIGDGTGGYDNPRGYWEYLPLVRFNDDLLASLSSAWYLPPIDDASIRALGENPTFREKALALIEEMNRGGRVWYWKDPRMIPLLPFWEQFLVNPIFIVPLRNPVNIVASLQKRERYWDDSGPEIFPTSAILLLWQYSMMKTFSFIQKNKNSLLLDYEQLVRSPKEVCETIAGFLDRSLSVRSRDRVPEMMKAVDPKFFRNQSEQTLNDLPIATAEQRALSVFISRKLGDPETSFEPGQYALYPGWREYLSTLHTGVRSHLISSNIRHRAQLYFDEGSGFTEQRSIVRPIHGGEVQLDFSFGTSSSIAGLRFDPASLPVISEVLSIVVRDDLGQQYEAVPDQSNALEANNRTYLFATEDPQIQIALPAMKGKIAGLQIQLRYIAFGDEAIRYIFSGKNQIIADRDEALIAQANAVARAEELLAQKSKTIAEREESLAQKEWVIAQQGETIRERDNAIARKEHDLRQKDEILKQKDDMLARKDKAIAEREHSIAHLNSEVRNVREELEHVYESWTWQIGRAVVFPWRLVHDILPQWWRKR